VSVGCGQVKTLKRVENVGILSDVCGQLVDCCVCFVSVSLLLTRPEKLRFIVLHFYFWY